MAANWMRGKLAKMRTQRAAQPMQLPDVEPSHHDTDQLVLAFMANGGKITRCACEGIMPRLSYVVMGKGRRTLDRRTFGNGRRKGLCYVGATNIR